MKGCTDCLFEALFLLTFEAEDGDSQWRMREVITGNAKGISWGEEIFPLYTDSCTAEKYLDWAINWLFQFQYWLVTLLKKMRSTSNLHTAAIVKWDLVAELESEPLSDIWVCLDCTVWFTVNDNFSATALSGYVLVSE